ncbi:MAG: hypothetical protein K2N73_06445 [Lachnospiraceae bacterium]|nr:hypothetical protein [Lachnospiraceae bacterium]
MRLYKMELYKICSKKIFIVSALAAIIIMLLYFGSFVIGAETTIDGVKYTGYQAVKKDREITEEFKGVLTDEKVTQIIEKFGFPSGVRQNYNTFLEKNYLNNFVMREFSDGYFHGWDDYHAGTCTYPIAETDLGKASEAVRKILVLEYSYGWNVFNSVIEIGCILGIFLMLFTISPVFSEENHINMRQILFTTKEGKTRDITAKIMAGMTVAVGLYAIIFIVDFMLVWCVFGLDGRNCLYKWVMEENFVRNWNNYNNISTMYVKDFVWLVIVFCFLGMVEAAAIILYFSAHSGSPFQSVITSALCLFAPICLNILGQGNYNSTLFIVGQLFDVLLLGIAITSFIPDFASKAEKFIIKMLCCILPLSAGIYLRKFFPFYYTLPVVMIITEGYGDIDVYLSRYPWIRGSMFLFVVILSAAFVVCSWKKYRN